MPERKFSESDYAANVSLMESGQVGSHNWEVGKTRLTLANMEIQADASRQLVTSTNELVKATRALAWLTLALVLVTIALAVVTAASAFGAKH